MLTTWPNESHELETLQVRLGSRRSPESQVDAAKTAGCYVCFGRGASGPGTGGDLGWAAAVTLSGSRPPATAEVSGVAGAPYARGLLAAREGPLLEAAVRALPERPAVLLVNATGWDHPRRAGLALHLGWVLDLPTVGVTHRPLVATGDLPGSERGARSALRIGDEQVGSWLRTRPGARPLAVSPGWKIDLDSACQIVEAAVLRARTPEPIRQARRLARTARSRAFGLGS